MLSFYDALIFWLNCQKNLNSVSHIFLWFWKTNENFTESNLAEQEDTFQI